MPSGRQLRAAVPSTGKVKTRPQIFEAISHWNPPHGAEQHGSGAAIVRSFVARRGSALGEDLSDVPDRDAAFPGGTVISHMTHKLARKHPFSAQSRTHQIGGGCGRAIAAHVQRRHA